MSPVTGKPVRGSTTGRPLMVLLDLLGQRWTLRILWELRTRALKFREVQENCGNISPTVLNTRLRDLKDHGLVTLGDEGYELTLAGQELGAQMTGLDQWANKWAEQLETDD